MKKRASIDDIVKELKVSATTISFILNDKAEEKRISGDVKRKMLDYVNQIAKSLRTGKTNIIIIGMQVEDISDPFFTSISRGIESIADKHQYKILFASTENDTEKTKALIKVFRERQVDGHIMAPPLGVKDEIKVLMDDNVPVILFDRYLPSLSTSTVIIDNFSGSYQAVKHLEKYGFSNIAFITLESDQTQMQASLQGYIRAIEENLKDPIVKKLPYKLSHDLEAEKLVQDFIVRHGSLDATIFTTSYLAINGLKAIRNLGLSIPGDIAVGFDDNTHFYLFTPSITAAAQPIEEISEEVVKQLLDALSSEKESSKRRTVTLPVKHIERKSFRTRTKTKLTLKSYQHGAKTVN